MAGEFLQSLGQVVGALGFGWRCRHCNQWSNEYTGNIIDGTSRCPNCGLDPNPFAQDNDQPSLPEYSSPSQDSDTSSQSYTALGLLTEADLADVQRALWEGRAKWYNLGLELGLTAGTLDAIQQTNVNNVDNCFRNMLKEWLRKTELVPTWSSLARALREAPVGLGELAQRLPD